MKNYRLMFVLVFALSLAAVALIAAEKSVVTPVADVKWASAGVPGVSIAPVEGDMQKGPSHFYLKYDAGFSAPAHHHSPDHYVTTVSGTLVLTVDGKENRLAPGSYFALLGKAKHTARVEGDQPCVMFIDARGPWDVVMEEGTTAKK
jgi:quercetin dioxygenase-like cupin family protein